MPTVSCIISKMVADTLVYIGDEKTKETERFVRFFDRFFDMLNPGLWKNLSTRPSLHRTKHQKTHGW